MQEKNQNKMPAVEIILKTLIGQLSLEMAER